MLTIQRPVLFFLMCSATVFLVPFLFSGFRPVDPETVRFIGLYVLIAELLCYGLWLALFTRSNPVILIAVPLALAAYRLSLAVIGALYISLMNYGTPSTALFVLWFGNPLAVLLQVLVILYMLPYVLAVSAPGVLAGTRFENLLVVGGAADWSSARLQGNPVGTEIVPSGGMLQIFGVDDIPRYFRKVAGLEGFAIFTSEGLLFIHDLARSPEVELLGVRLHSLWSGLEPMMKDCDLDPPRRLALETETFTVLVSPISAHFWSLFLFNKNVSLDNCHNKVQLLVNSARRFLDSRYILD
ncbi:MAG: hypothetical protein Kow0059_17810 [Candidatus Sumerlaeia bacterium]